MDEEERNYCHTCEKIVEETHKVTQYLDDGTEAEYSAYCKECGDYLYTFCYGHIEY